MARSRQLRYRPHGTRSGSKLRLLMAAGVAIMALISYFGSSEYNPVTGEKQYLSLTPKQEIALGLQAAPQMAQQHGGLHRDPSARALVDEVGERLVEHSKARETSWQFDFHLLADERTVNAFALPGGQVFITAALYKRLETTGQLAGVLGHEIGHVVARHGAQRMAKQQLTQGLGTAAGVAGGYSTAQMAQMIAQMVNMKYGREDELESDSLGVLIMASAGYDPRALKGVMRILAEASGASRQPEFFSTHPSPDNRIGEIDAAITVVFPNGVPPGLEP